MKIFATYLTYGWLSSLLLIAGCDSDDMLSPDSTPSLSPAGSNYYPLSVNQYAIYRVEDVRYSLRGADTTRYQLQEKVADSLLGAGREIIYSLERYTRSSSNESWGLDSVWTVRKNERRVVVVENNVPYVKLVFPFQDELQWNGNMLNSRPTLTYSLTPTDSSLVREIGPRWDTLMNDSQTVIQRSLETLVNDSVLVETYGAGVGLLYKKSRILQYCADEDCIGQKKIESGRSYRQTLLEYGKD